MDSNESIFFMRCFMNTWDERFTPSYTPEEMLRLGVFEGKYINAIKGNPQIPKSWFKIPKVLRVSEQPDPAINKFKVKSRLSLSEWKKNKWITEASPNGWFEWYIKYFLGKRLPEEDDMQIKRWISFCARHQGQITKSGDISNLEKRAKQRQGLLQWGWDSTKEFTELQRDANLKKLVKENPSKVKIGPKK